MADQHWATLEDAAEVARAAQERFRKFEDTLRERDLDSMKLATYAYYGCDENGHSSERVGKEGSQDQVRYVVDDEFGTAMRNMLTLACAQPGGFIPVPRNTDSTAQQASMVVKGVLEHYFDPSGGGLDETAFRATENGRLHHWAWISGCWDEDIGDPVQDIPVMGATSAPPAGDQRVTSEPPAADQRDTSGAPAEPQPEVSGWTQTTTGDPRFSVHLATDVAFEYDARGEMQWVDIRTWENKFDLAAKLEQRAQREPAEEAQRLLALAQQVREYRPDPDPKNDTSRELRDWRSEAKRNEYSDEVPVFELRHAVTLGCPEGRQLRYLTPEMVLEDGPAKYGEELECHMVKAGERIGTPRGFTRSTLALNLQRCLDALTSIPYSNLAAGGLNWWVARENSFVKAEDVNEALRMMYVRENPKEAIVPLTLAQTPPELYPFLQDIRSRIDAKFGMNEFSMGRDTKDRPGVMGALLDESAQRAVSDTAKMYNTDARLWMANSLVRLYAKYGTHSRKLPEIVGRSNQAMLIEFSGKHFQAVASVRAEPVPAIMRSTAGRLELANLKLEAKGKGMDPLQEQALIQLVMTGKDDQVTEPQLKHAINIQAENERLLAGQMLDSPPPEVDPLTGQPLAPMGPVMRTAIWSDPQVPHILGHASILTLTVRGDANIMTNADNHIRAHLMLCGPEDLMRLTAMGFTLPVGFRPPPMLPAGDPNAPQGSGEGGGVASDVKKALPATAGPNGPPTPQTPDGDRWSPQGQVTTQ